MSALEKLTIGVIAVATALLGIYDIVVAAISGKRATISWAISSLSMRFPIIPFAFGVLMGHFFAQDNPVS
jgi:hypothetical protein